MSPLLLLPLCELPSESLRSLAAELCHATSYAAPETTNLFHLLGVLQRDHRASLTSAHLPSNDAVLLRKIGHLGDQALETLCAEIAVWGQTHLGAWEGKTVLSLIRACVPRGAGAAGQPRGRNAARHERTTELIQRRRRNGSF